MIAILVSLVAIILFALVITAMHLSHKNDIAFIKSEAREAIETVAVMSYRQGWMHGSADERSMQRKAIDDVILAHV